MAAYDLYQWDTEVRCVAPDGGTVSCWRGPSWSVVYTPNATRASSNTYQITVNWVEQATGQPLNYTLTVQI